ncbi:ABC transporter permease [Methylobacterium sp. ID0610]|uniref:ABC transporter permease n=1 Tax=Methylobacterium carpenticola TaxID=3344827 RepID=UPI0036AE4967
MKPDHLGTLLVLLAGLAAWQILAVVAGGAGIASPAQTITALRRLLADPGFWRDVAETGRAFGLSLAIVLAGGIALGLVLGTSRLAGEVTEPILVTLYALPKVTLYPVVLLLFGLGLSARVAFGVMHGVIPLTLFAMNAVLRMRPVYLRTAATMRLTRWQTVATVIWPAILPEIYAGARLAVSLTLLGVLIGEMFASQRGLGHLAVGAMERGDMASVLAVALLLTGFAVTINAALLALDRTRQR